MTTLPRRRRWRGPNIRTGLGIAAAIVLTMVVSLGWMLGQQIRDLDSAGIDNTQWTLAQLELETAIFGREVASNARAAPEDIALDGLRLRFDILLSRLGLVRSGEIGRALLEHPGVPELLARIDAYADRVDALFASEVVDAETLGQIYDATLSAQSEMRQLSLHGLDILADDAESYRHSVRRQAEMTALAGGLLLILLGALLRLIDVQRRRVLERDRVLSRTAERLNSVIGSSLDAIVVADHHGNIIDFNPAAEEIFGWCKDEILGLALRDTIIPLDKRDLLDRALRSDSGLLLDRGRVELEARRRSGEVFPVEVVMTSVEGSGGDPVLIGYLRDITDVKAGQDRLIAARDRAEHADRAKSRFLSVMSHEMRTPLNGIMGVLDLLGTSPLDPEQRRKVGVALASAEILLQLVNESLDITRIETGEETIELAPFAPGQMLQRLISVLRPLAAEKDLPLELVAAEADLGAWYHGDPNRIAQVITNLIGNAIKFTERGAITVELRLEADGIEIAVHDTGIGIAAEDLEKVFAEFVTRARPEGRQGRSDGLGLAISRRLARLMSGDITVSSLPGKGSTFRLTLPLQPAASPQDGPEPAAEIAPPEARLSVLVVEDNAVNRMVLRGMLQQWGHAVEEAPNGAKGLEMLRAARFDLVLMDFEMPVMGGIDTMLAIRDSMAAEARPPVIGLTAHGSAEARQAGLEAGMSDVYAKPLRLSVLRRILKPLEDAARTARSGDAPQEDRAWAEIEAEAAPELDEEEDEGSRIDTEAFSEILEMLGAEPLSRALDRFGAECHEAAPRLSSPEPGEGGVVEAAHKLRGGAAMLGLGDAADMFGLIELRAPDRVAPEEVAEMLHEVEAALEEARARIGLRAEA